MGKRTHKLTKVKEQLKQEIEDPKQAEEAVQQSEELYPKKVEDNDSDKGHEEIVIVDDTPASLNATRRVLKREGYKVVGFTDPEELLKYNLENTDLILCDILMPKIDGFGVLERVKGDERYQHLPFVFLSGSDVEYRQIAKAFESGASDFVSKRCDRGELLGRVRKALMEGRIIAEKKRAEGALRESEELYRTLVENIKLGINLIDSDYNIVMANAVLGRKFGKPHTEVVGKKCFREMEKRDSICPHCPGARAMAAGKPKVIETEGVLDSGSRFNVKIQAFPIFGQDGRAKGFIEVVEDITKSKRVEEEKRKLETQLLQSEKMASIGQLAAGVAHEINNPTGFVSSNLKTLSDYQNDMFSLIKEYKKLIVDLKETVATAEYPGSIPEQMKRIEALESEVDIDYILDDSPNLIKESREGTERIKRIVIDLKDFAHPGEQELKYANINKNLDSTLNIVWNELKYKTTVTKDYGDLPEVQCYPQQLNQVFMNLMLNAAQAIEKEGKIRIATRAVDGHVEIAISDTGVGIHKENLSKIFDPFFTTKDVGKGTGLGLNVAYNIIKKHKGTIDVKSEVGTGTTFIIRIPVGRMDED